MIPLKPGLYTVSWEDYLAIPAINQSALKHIGKSPLHFQHRRLAGVASNDPMRLGSAAHTAILEPHLFDKRFAVFVHPEGKKERRAGGIYEDFCAAHPGQEILKPKDQLAAEIIADSVRRNKLARRYLERGQAERVLVWQDEVTGLLCKARLDWISESVPDVMCELKTTTDVSPGAFPTRFAKQGYDVQTAFYCDGYKRVVGRDLHPKCIAIESGAPHDVVVYDLAEVIEIGRAICRGYLDKYAECLKSDSWPGQAPDAEIALHMPRWRDPFDGDEDEDWATLPANDVGYA